MLSKNLCISELGELYDRNTNQTIRPNYSRTWVRIKTVADVKATLRAGPFAWPGGYPLYFVCTDGEPLSFESARKEFDCIVDGFRFGDPAWTIIGVDVNWENEELFCSHSNERIESAYGECPV